MPTYSDCFAVFFERQETLASSRRWFFQLIAPLQIKTLYVNYNVADEQFMVLVEDWEETIKLARFLDDQLAPVPKSSPLAAAAYFGGHNASVVQVLEYNLDTEYFRFRGNVGMYQYEDAI